MGDGNVPEWLTADFLKVCLETDKENFPDSINITNHTVEPAVPAGTSYGSLMLRVRVTYQKKINTSNEDHIVSLIVKAPLKADYIEKFNEAMPDLYQTEPKFYGEYIVETYKHIKHNIVPKHYPSTRPRCVVLEDLKVSGYVMVNRQKLLDFDHCQLYIKASAMLHALSIAVNKENPELIQSLVQQNPEMEKAREKVLKGVVTSCVRCMAAYIKDKPSCKEYFDVITEFVETDKCWSTLMELDNFDELPKALTLGDPWCANMMFRYDSSGTVQDIKLLDFQSLKFNSPVTEFIIFLWISVNPDVRETRLDDLYYLYCDSLNSSLEELGCSERIPFDMFKQEVVRLSPLALVVTCTMMPFCVSEEPIDMNEFYKDRSPDLPIKENPIFKLFERSTFEKYCQQTLKQLEREGIFDYIKGKLS